jgi:putative ATPase
MSGLADSQALVLAMAAQGAVHFLGWPEANTALAQLTLYLAVAPKSNAAYARLQGVRDDVEKTRNDPVPLHLRNAPTALMKGLDYGKGYQYAHDYAGAIVDQEHLPPNLAGRRYYQPTERGREAAIGERMRARAEQLAANGATKTTPDDEPEWEPSRRRKARRRGRRRREKDNVAGELSGQQHSAKDDGAFK